MTVDENTCHGQESTDDRMASLLAAIEEAFEAGFSSEELRRFIETELSPTDRQWLDKAQRFVQLLNLLRRSTQDGAHRVHTSDRPIADGSTDAQSNRQKPFPGTARFEVLRQLGAGSMGVVYEVLDRERDLRVALKTLNPSRASRILRFKQEFRRLANVVHDNVVVLHELFHEGDDWFFTMELVDGVDFLTAIRDRGLSGLFSTSTVSRLTEAKLCRLFRQLAEGLNSLHAAGILHRDLKPTNVLVTRDDRVVVIDFGLATSFRWGDLSAGQSNEFVGTCAYMAPEQAACRPVTPASDWYSLGVMLFQVLTGRVPFEGPLLLLSKQVHDPPTISQWIPGIPPTWNELCRGLIARLPANRPTGHDVLERLHSMQCGAEFASVASTSLPQLREIVEGTQPFVGRIDQLEQLRGAYKYSCDGHPIVVPVQGTSGVGKTVLVERFLNELQQEGAAVVLRGCCHQRESVPHKTVDSLVDSLCQYLNRLPAKDLVSLLPADVTLLSRMFPVLRCVPAIARACADYDPPDPKLRANPQPLRRRALDAFRELLSRMADRSPLVLFIDDLHWGDSPGAVVLANLIHSARPPRLMLILAFRQEQTVGNQCIAAFGLDRIEFAARDASHLTAPRIPHRFKQAPITVPPLTPSESRTMAATLLAQQRRMVHGNTAEADIDSSVEEEIAAESGGLPYFVQELVQHSVAATRQTCEHSLNTSIRDTHRLDLNEVLWQRVQRLPETAQSLVTTVAVTGHPIRLDLACEAAVAKPLDARLLRQLQTSRLLFCAGPGWRDNVTTFHDRVRECVVSKLSADERRELHRRLATVLESSGDTDSETLAHHFDAANNIVRARHYYILAAAAAQEVFAFERAAELYARALDLTPDTEDDTYPLLRKLGEACGQAGHGGDSAAAYLAAAEIAPPAEVLELRLAAARQYCMSGYTDEGRILLRDVLATHGIRLRNRPTAIAAALVSQRLRLAWRGPQYQLHPEHEVDPAVIRQIDLIWDAASGLSFQEPLVVAWLHARGLLEALEAGEPKRLARALSLEAILSATIGTRTRNRVRALLAEADKLVAQLDDPVSRGMLCLARGGTAFLQVRMPEAVAPLREAESWFSAEVPKSWWELTTSRSLLVWAYMHLGDFRSLRHCLVTYDRDAENRGDRFLFSSINSAGRPQLLLADNRPNEAQQRIDELTRRVPYEQFQQQHVSLLFSQAHVDLYRGNATAAWQRIQQNWPRLRRSMQLHNQFARVTMLDLRARCALSAYRQRSDRDMLIRARRDTWRLGRERGEWVRPFIDRLTAGIHEAYGNMESAAESLTATATGFDHLGFHIGAATARRRLGELVAGDAGRELVSSANQTMLDESVQCPAAFQAVYCY